jgi:hypothetical protein
VNNEIVNKRLAVNDILNRLILMMHEINVNGFWMLIKLREEDIEAATCVQERGRDYDGQIDIKRKMAAVNSLEDAEMRYNDYRLMLRQFRKNVFVDPKYDFMVITVTESETSIRFQQ